MTMASPPGEDGLSAWRGLSCGPPAANVGRHHHAETMGIADRRALASSSRTIFMARAASKDSLKKSMPISSWIPACVEVSCLLDVVRLSVTLPLWSGAAGVARVVAVQIIFHVFVATISVVVLSVGRELILTHHVRTRCVAASAV